MKILVTLVIIIGLSAIVGSIFIGKIVFDGKVVENPYETALRYDETMALRSKLILEMENRRLSVGENDIIFILSDSLGMPITDPKIKLMISRPYTTAYDKEYHVSMIEKGKYRAKIRFPLYGHWDIMIKFNYEQRHVNLKKRIYVEKVKY